MDLGNYSALLQQNPEWMQVGQRQNDQAPAPVASVAPTQTSAQSQGQEIGTLNERLANAGDQGASFIRQGEAQAQGAARQAAELGASADRASEFHQAAIDAVKSNKELQEQYRVQAEKDLARATEDVHGMAKWGPLLSGIVAAAAGSAGNTGLMAGMGMISSAVTQSAHEKASRATTAFEGHSQLARQAMADSQNELDASTKLMGQEHEITARRLEQIGQESSIPQFRETALRLAQGTRDEGLKMRQAYYSALGAQQHAQELARSKTARKLSVAELEAKLQAGTIMPDEYKELIALHKGAADIDKTNEDIRKSQAAPAGGKLSDADQKVATVLAGSNEALSRLSGLVSGKEPNAVDIPRFGVGGVSAIVPDAFVPEENLQYDADVNKLLETKLRAESGASISESEVKNARRALGLDSSDETVRARGIQALVNQVKTMQERLRPEDAASREQAGREAAGKKDVSRFAKYRVK